MRDLKVVIISLVASIVFLGAVDWAVKAFLTKAPEQVIEEADVVIYPVTVKEEVKKDIELPQVEIVEEVEVFPGVPLPNEEKAYLLKVCEICEVEPTLALALMATESEFKWVSGDWDEERQKYRSIGYFQIRDVNWDRLDKRYTIDATTRKGNIEAGITMIKELQDKYPDDLVRVLTAYKAGESKAKEICEAGITLEAVENVIEIKEGLDDKYKSYAYH